MTCALNDTQLALLHTHLVVPLAIGDILYGELALTDDVQYELHEALSEVDPDSALLAIAVGAKHIAQALQENSPIAAALSIECDKILDEYGPEWLSNYHKGPVDEDRLYDLLQHIPEDLESLADLLDTLCLGVEDAEDPVKKLCDILSIQARAHMEIADFILTELAYEEGENLAGAYSAHMVPDKADNIILFPIHRVRQSAQ